MKSTHDKWMLQLRSDSNEQALRTLWWHRLFRVALWLGLVIYYWKVAVWIFATEMDNVGGYITYSRVSGVAITHQGITPLEFFGEMLLFVILGYVLFFAVQFFYYKILLYVAYGKSLPTM